MTEQELKETKIPILKPDALVSVEIDFNTAGSIAQSLIFLTKNWTKEKRETFQKNLMERKAINELDEVVFVYLDLLYKKILKSAKENDQLEYKSMDEAINPLA